MKRIAVRLLAFNLLLVFLPAAGVLYLGAYEARLETAEARSIAEEGRIVAAALGRDAALNPIDVDELLARTHSDVRFRVLDTAGRVIADSRPIPPPQSSRGSPRHNTLYRIGVFVARPFLRLMPPEAPLDVDLYDSAERLLGPEVRAALDGHEGVDKKISAGGQRSVTLYRAVPIVNGGRVTGAVLASASTYPILQDLYAVRLSVMRILVAALVAAFLVSVFFSTTIVRPLRQLRRDARRVLDRRTGALHEHFKGSARRDEIGELSRALERIMRRLDGHLRFIETFATDVSHELRNPLASIRNATEMLAEVNDPADRRRFVQMIEQEIARMEKLLAGVREISVIDARLAREERTPIELGALLQKIVDGFRLREGNRVQFELDVQPQIVEASEDRLIQVFENILDNAVSFSPTAGTVRVSTRADGAFAVVRVEDEGPGIPDAHLARIFDRFFTYRPAAARRDSRHTGLGLSIVRAIVAGYGGSVTAANGERGAMLEVRLPAGR